MVMTLFTDVMTVAAGDMALFRSFAVTARDIHRVFVIMECFAADHAMLCPAVILYISILRSFTMLVSGLAGFKKFF